MARKEVVSDVLTDRRRKALKHVTRKVLTDRGITALKPAASGKRDVVWDATQPHLGVRVTDKGAKSFVVVRRRPGAPHPDVWVIGRYPGVKLKAARDAVPGILRTLGEGKSAKQRKAEEAREAARRRADTFAVAVEKFIEEKKEKRTCREMEAVLRREFLGQKPKRTRTTTDGVTKWVTEWTDGKKPVWRDRPIIEITRRDVIERLDEIKAVQRARSPKSRTRGGKHAARHALTTVRSLFSWAEEGERFGLEKSPAAGVRDKTIGITREEDLERDRTLSDAELRDAWRAADAAGYPFGRLVQVLMLTGQRVNDVAMAQRSEIDLDAALLNIPKERYKTNRGQVVPLTPKAGEILSALPKFERGYVFTTTAGARPISGLSKMKARLDAAIAKERAKRSLEPMPPWVLHDLRRTVRSRLVTDLGVDAFIAERVLGHALAGLHRVYDRSSHLEPKREALEKWEKLLLSIVEPPPRKTRKMEPTSNVVPLRKRRRA